MSERGINFMRKFENAALWLIAAMFCLTSSGLAVAQTTLSVTSVNFANVVVGTASATHTITVKNTGGAPITISSLSVTAGTPYAISGSSTCLTPTLAAGKSCTVILTDTPTALGAEPTGTLTVTSTAPNSPNTVMLSGTGVNPTALSASSENFGNVVVGTASAIKTVTLYNYQSTPLSISSITATPSVYAVTGGTCPTAGPGSLGAGATCTITLTLTPSSTGAAPAGTLTVASNAPNSPNTAALSGTGVAAVTLSPSSLAFGNVAISTTSATKTVTLRNLQPNTLTITSALFGGPFALDTSANTTCPMAGGTVSGTLAAGASCVIGVTFDPTATGPSTGGQITLIDSASNSPQLATLSGTGFPATTLSTSVGFGNVVENTTSSIQFAVLRNYQSVPLTFTSITAPLPYAVTTGSNSCSTATPLAAGGDCYIYLTFTPTALGSAPASNLTVVDNAASGPTTLSSTLNGFGVVAVSIPPSLAFGNVVVGQQTEKNISLKNYQTIPLTITSISGFTGGYSLDATNTTCSLTVPLAPGLSCVIGVDLTATTLGAQPPASFSVSDNASSSPQTVSLTATAISQVKLSPTSLSFPATLAGVTSSPLTITLTNEQNVALTIASVTISGTNPNDFAVTSNCPTAPASLPGTQTCQINVTFDPTATGTRTATLNVADNASLGNPPPVPLTGAGNPPVTISPDSTQTFSANVGTTSAYKTFTITNKQPSTALIFNNPPNWFTGDFIQSATTCPIGGAGLAGGSTCTVSVEFDPSIGGVRDGQFQLYDSASTSPQVVNLTGTGTSPLTISPSSLSFSAQTVGTVSPAKIITLTNHETQSETFSLATTGDYTANSNCLGVITANGGTCLIFISFTPSSVTPSPTRTGTLTVTDSAPGGSALVANLTGSATATPPPAAVSVVSPGAGADGTAVNVVITGNGWTHFSNSSVITFVEEDSTTTPCDIAVSNEVAATPNTIDATLTLSGPYYGGCNIKVVTPLSGGGSETAKLISAFTIADPTQAHTITSVTPAVGSQGQTMQVLITASGTHFVQTTPSVPGTIANFGDGITVNSLTVIDATDAQANITISNTTPIGYRTITMQTNGEFAVSVLSPQGNPIFQITPNSAALLSISPTLTPVVPTVVPQGWSGQVYLTASGTHFLQSATQLSVGGGVIVGAVDVTSPTTAIAQLSVPANATLGVQDATVSTGGEIATLNSAITITGATPALLSVAPSSGVQGQSLTVTIIGNAYTNFVSGQTSATFDGNISSPTVNVISPNEVQIPITIATDANVGSITAHLLSGPVGNVTIFPFTFTVTPSSASIVSVTPNCVPQGGQLTLTVTGSNTNWATAQTTAAFYPTGVPTPSFDEITINSSTSAQLAVAVPTNSPVGSYGFYLSTGGQVVSASMNVCANTPTLTMSPANGLLPTAPNVNQFTANFTGQFTHWNSSTLAVMGGEGVTLTNFKVFSAVSASATVTIVAGTNGTPTATGPRLVTLTTGGEIVTTNFNVTSTPVGLISVTPDHAPPSTTNLSVEIIGLNTHFTSGTTQVLFGPQITVNSVQVNSPTDLIANISTSYMLSGVLTPSPSGWQSIYVNTGAEQVMGGFLVDYPATPSLLSVSPSSGAQGSTLSVVITGSLTNWQGAGGATPTEAILGAGVSVSDLSITSPTTATATLTISPTAPVGGNTVVMITGSEVVSGSGFSVTPSAASIQSVGPVVQCDANLAIAEIPGCGTPGSGTPWVVAQLQTTTLNIVGVGTHWLQGETYLSFGPGVVVDQLMVSSPTTATAQITVLSTAPVGFATLTAYTDGEVVSLQQAIDIEDGSPVLLAISPTSAQQGASLNVQVLGRFTHFTSTGTTVTSAAFNQVFPGDITVNSVNVIDSQNMTVNITVSPLSYVDTGYPCGHTLTITTGSEQVGGLPGNFCIVQGGEEITNVTPLSAIQGSTLPVMITGQSTNFIQGVTQVSFGDSNFQVGQITVNSPTSITVPVAVTTSAQTGFKTVTVTTYGQVASQQYSFTVEPGVATLNEAIPNQAEQGAPLSGQPSLVVRLIGQYSHFSSESTATFGAGITVQSVAYVSPTEVDATISIDPLSYVGGRTVTVTTPSVSCAYQPTNDVAGVTYQGCTPGVPTGTGSEIVTNSVFSIIPGPAIISNVAPNTGNEGQEVVFNITGANTHWAQNFTRFYIAGGGSDLTINSVVINSATSATVDMSISPTANPGARSIYMVTNGESLTDSGAFVVTGGVPVIAYLSPSSTQNNPSTGTTGLEVDIYGIYTNWAAGSSTVNFGPGITVESFQVDNATHIEAVIDIAANAQLGYRTVVVQTGTQGLTGNFLVSAPAPPPTPYIWYLSPGSGLPGQTFTITFNGAYTHWDPGTGGECSQSGTTLTGFNASVTVNCFQVTSPTTAIANITIAPDATASVSDLTLTTGSEVENAQFSVVIAQPTLSIVDPGSGLQGAQNITVNILGQYTTFDATTTFQFGSGITTVGAPTILGPTIATQVISINQLAPLGGSSVVATTPDAAPIAQVVGGAGFTVTPSLALIAAIMPNTSAQGTTITVDVTGQNTHWDGSTTFSIGDGIVITNAQVNSPTDATLTLAIPAYAGEGPTSATAHTGGEVANINNGFVVTAGTPYLLSSGPGSVPQQGSAVFTILSQATKWLTNPPVVSYGLGIELTNTTVTSDTSLTVDGYVDPTTPVGYRNLTVTTGTQVLGINNAIYVSPGPAVINNLSPNTAGQGANITTLLINGTNTHWLQGTTQITSFPGVVVNSFVVNSPTQISANITVAETAPAGQVSVTVSTVGEVATGINVFTITQTQPELLAAVPSSGVQGLTETPVTLTGAFTHFNTAGGCAPNCSTLNFGTGITVDPATVVASSPTSVTADITISPTTTLGYRNVSVATGSEVVTLNNGFNVTAGPAEILGPLNPASGGQGNSYSVVVTGSQTHFAQGTTTASFGGGIQVTGVTVTDLLHATVNITIPDGTALGQYNVVLTTGGEVATILGGFTVTSGTPQISVVNPPTGNQGATIASVQLTGLFTHWVNGTSIASFGSGITVNSLTVTSPTQATANITISPTATLGSRNVSVTTGSEVASITGGFTVLGGIPQLLTVVQSSGQAGATLNLVITGEFTTFQQGFTTVSLGDGITTNFVTVNSITQVTANITIPAHATVETTYVTVTTNSTPLTLNNAFSVTAGTPVITQINPNIGNPGQTLNVTLTGQYTNWVQGTTTASFGAGITVNTVTVNSITSATVNITIGASTPVGPVTVTTTTGGEVENVPGGFTVQAASIPAPSLISLSPGPNYGSTGVGGTIPINSSIIGVFSQPMNRTTITTSTVLLTLEANNGGSAMAVPGTVTVDATGRIVTFTPNSLLAVNSQYYLNLTSGIKDATGNTFNNYGVYLYTELNANTTPPTVVAANPPANATNVGTNVIPQLEFSTDMNQNTESGMVVSTGGNPVAGTWSWNSYPYGSPYWGPGNVLTFTPTAPLAANTTYMVSYGAPLADTAGNALTAGSFTFTTGSGADTSYNYSGSDFTTGLTNVGTNFTPRMNYTKPVNPLDINTSTLLLYNNDSGKYIQGTVTLAPNGLSATFTPQYPLLPNTYYRFYQSGGNYDMDGNYMYGVNDYFTTGAGQDTTPPVVASVSPADGSGSVPLNAQVIVHFSAPVDPDTISSAVTLTPSGGSAVAGTATLASDMVTLFFVPTPGAGTLDGSLQPGTVYTIQVSGYADEEGNTGAPFTSTFTTATSTAPIIVSTGLNAAGNLITANNTADGHWVYYPESGTPSESTFGSPSLGTADALETVGPGDTGWYGGWVANGPNSDWITINPSSTTKNTYGLYYTTFNIPGSSVPSNLCLVGLMGVDDNGELALNGTAIMGNVSAITSLTSLNIPVSSFLVTGPNVLSLGWGSTDNSYEAFRLQAAIETCGASYTGGLTLTSATPSNAATAVATSTTITLTFNNALDPATVNSTTLPVMVGWNSNQEIAGNYAVSGNQVVFTPDTPFPVSTTIYVGACGGPYDTAGDSAATGGCYTQLLYFTTGSTATPAGTPFQVMAFAPAANATNVGLRAPVAATFNRSLNMNTINSNDFALFSGDGQSPWCSGGNYSHSQDDTTILFNCGIMPSSATMTAVLSGGLQDWQGNALTSFKSQFTTTYYDSNTNGAVITSRPGNGAGGISTSEPITLFFNLPIDPSTANSGFEVAQNNIAVPGSVSVQDNGYTLVFTPSSSWTPGALIQWWTNGSLINTTYNTPINNASGYFYVAADTSTLAPTVQVFTPGYEQTAATNAVVDLQFNTPLNQSTATSANIYIYDTSNGTHVTATYTYPQPNEVRIVPQSALKASDTFYVYITTGVQSSTSVPVATQIAEIFYTSASTDSTLPTIVSAVPFNGATNVGINVSPGVVLSKTIDPVSVTSTTFQVLNGATPLPGTFYLSSNDTRVQFVPNDALPANTTLTMKINGVLDLVGNPITFNSAFQTGPGPDFSTPTVVWTSVSSNESIPTNSAITIDFSESMDVTTFNTTNIRINDTLLGSNIAATLSWNSTQTIAYLLPSAPLAAGRQYYFQVSGGTDLAGNVVSGVGFYFYAGFNGSTTAPTVINFNPLNGATGVGTNVIIEAQFSAPIDPTSVSGVTLSGGVNITPVLSAANTVLQLVPSAPLAPNTSYTLTIAGVKDPAGNVVSTVTNTFTTGATYDITPPTVVTIDPPSNATVGTNVTPKLLFNKPLNPLTITNNIFALVLNDTGQSIPITVSLSANGLEVTITPQIPLLPNTYYRYSNVNGGGPDDEDGNYDDLPWYYFYTGAGSVNSGPTVAVSPVNAATDIPLNAKVIATLSAPMDETSWTQNSIQLLNGSTPVPGTVALVNDEELTFTPTSSLLAGTMYTVTVSGFTDANGNTVVPSNTTFTTAGTASGGGLTFTGANITNGATVTSSTQQIVLTFSQALDPATVNSSTLEVMDTWNSNRGIAGTYVVNGNQVTFTPANPYPAGAQITVGECGGPTDVLGDVFQNGNCWTQELLYFNAPATSVGAPTILTVLSVSPANGASNVGRDQPVSVTFNNPINSSTTGGTNTQLYAGQALQTNGSVTWSADGRTITFNIGALYNGTTYTIAIPAGGVTDYWGNSLTTPFTSTFTTVADPATGNGSVQSTAPGANATGVPTSSLLTLYMNRQVDAATVSGNLTVAVNGVVYPGTVQSIADGYEVQYTPTTPFPNGATVQWYFSNVYDVYGDVFNSDSGYFYTAAAINPSAAPTLVAISPNCCYSTNVPTNAEIDLEFSSAIDPSTLSGIYQYSGPSAPATVALVSGSPNIVRITPNSPFAASTAYAYCNNTTLKGANGVAVPSNCYATYFTTTTGADTTPGTVTIGPPNGSTNVGTNAYIRLQFSKPVDRTSINATNVTVTANSVAVPGTWSFNVSNNDVIGANFYPVNPLPPSTPVSISVSGLLDYAGNTFTSASSSFTTGALPDYSTPNVTLDFGNNTTGISTTASFTCLYSEPMDPSSINAGNTYLYSYVANAHVPVTYTWAPDMMSVTMTPTAPLFASSEYQYYCQNGIDLTGNAQGNNNAYFYTGNGPIAAGPALVQANPPNGMTNVPVNTNNGPWNNTSLNLLFSEPVATDSLSNITLTPSGGSPIPIAVYPEDGNYIASVQLPYALSPNTTYTYNVSGVTDLSGNPTASTTSTFTTGTGFDFTNAGVTATNPVNGTTTTGVPTSVSVTFSEAMDPVLINTNEIYLRTHNTQTVVPSTISISSDYKTVTLTPISPLAQSTIYDIYYYPNPWWLTDIAGNNSTANYGILSTFTTGTTTAVNGVCGSANGGSFSSPPLAATLCSAGTASAITNPGSWTWSCNGQYSGTNAPCSATVAGGPACYAQPSGLVSWWTGNDNATDLVGGNNGTLENGAGFALGEVGDAFTFNGSNQYVLIGQPVPASLQIQNNITMSAWIYVTSYPANVGSGPYQTIVGSEDSNHSGIGLYLDGSTGITGVPPGSLDLDIGNGSSWYSTYTTTQVPLNQWVMVTITATANQQPKIYYDGVLQPVWSPSSETVWNGTVPYTGTWFAIGQTVSGNYAFNGQIDDVQVYNTALTSTQVQSIYNAGSTGLCP